MNLKDVAARVAAKTGPGRCQHCRGTGFDARSLEDCPKCFGTGTGWKNMADAAIGDLEAHNMLEEAVRVLCAMENINLIDEDEEDSDPIRLVGINRSPTGSSAQLEGFGLRRKTVPLDPAKKVIDWWAEDVMAGAYGFG